MNNAGRAAKSFLTAALSAFNRSGPAAESDDPGPDNGANEMEGEHADGIVAHSASLGSMQQNKSQGDTAEVRNLIEFGRRGLTQLHAFAEKEGPEAFADSAPTAKFSSKAFSYARHKFRSGEGGKGGRPSGSGARTRQDLGNLVLVKICEYLLSGGETCIYRIWLKCHAISGGESEENQHDGDSAGFTVSGKAGRSAVEALRQEAMSEMMENRVRRCYAVSGMAGFAFVAQYVTSERVDSAPGVGVENGVGGNRAACCWVDLLGKLKCSCVGSSALSVFLAADGDQGTAKGCDETRALSAAVKKTAEMLSVTWSGMSFPDIERFLLSSLSNSSSLEIGDEDANLSDESDDEEYAVGEAEVLYCRLFGPEGRLAVVITQGRAESGGSIAGPVILSKRDHPNCCICVSSSPSCVHSSIARASFSSSAREQARAARNARVGALRTAAEADETEEAYDSHQPNLEGYSEGEDEHFEGRSSGQCGIQSRGASRAGITRESLPLVDCDRSLQLDKTVSSLARNGKNLFVRAPKTCETCESSDGVVRKICSGSVMAYDGAVALMEVEEFYCQNSEHVDESLRSTSGDGTIEGIVLYTLHTAVTTRFLRDVCSLHAGYGDSPLGALLRSKRAHAFSERRSAARRGVLMALPRSLKTLRGCIYSGMRLMCEHVESGMFSCPRCQSTGRGGVRRIYAMNSDASFLGYKKNANDQPFRRVFAKSPLTAPPGKGSFRISDQMVDAELSRKTLVFAAKNGSLPTFTSSETILFSPRNFQQGLLALAVLCEFNHLFGGNSVTAAQVRNIGGASVAVCAAKRKCLEMASRGASLLVSVECVVAIAENVTASLQQLTRAGHFEEGAGDIRFPPGRASKRKKDCYDALSASLKIVIDMGKAIPADSPMVWKKADRIAVYKLMEQVLGDSSISLLSKRYLSAAFNLCESLRGTNGDFDGAVNLINGLAGLLNQTVEGNDDMFGDVSDPLILLRDIRLIRDAVTAIANLADIADRRRICSSVYWLVLSSATAAKEYYDRHDESLSPGILSQRTCPRGPSRGQKSLQAICDFRRQWSGESVAEDKRGDHLREKFEKEFGAGSESPYVNGICMPDQKQCRPFPFYGMTGADLEAEEEAADVEFEDSLPKENDPVVSSWRSKARGAHSIVMSAILFLSHALLGGCSKLYLDAKQSFSPGAFTLTCSCSHPILLGFVVLDRAEGPLILLNLLVAFFALLPCFLIYDFACGAFKCAVLTLPWVVAVTNFVSDLFHVKNHTCTPIYHVKCHAGMDGRNSLGHEQRNRAIRNLERTIRGLKRENYITVLWYQAKFLNHIVHCEAEIDRLKALDPKYCGESFDRGEFYLRRYPCRCCEGTGE